MYNIENNYQFSSSFIVLTSQIESIQKAFKEFLTEGYKLVNSKQEKLDAELKNVQEKDLEEAEIFYQHYYEDARLVNHDLSSTFLISSVSYLYSQFEIYFYKIAFETKELFGSKLTLKDFTDTNKGISKTKNFILEISKIDISDQESVWSQIKNFQRIRNCFVHRNGFVNKERAIIEFAKNQEGLEYHKESDTLIITYEYLLKFCDIFFEYLHNTMDRIWEKHKEGK